MIIYMMLCNTTAITLNVKMGFLTLFHGGVGQPLKGPQKPWKLEEQDSFFPIFQEIPVKR